MMKKENFYFKLNYERTIEMAERAQSQFKSAITIIFIELNIT